MGLVRESNKKELKQWDELINTLNSYDEFVLIAHIAPDGDSIGSALALKSLLIDMGKNAEIICDGEAPKYLKKLENIDAIIRYNAQSSYKKNNENRVAIAVDCADRGRLGAAIEVFDASAKKIVIDHHISNDGFGDITVIDGEASATGEIISELLNRLNLPLTEKIASYIYVAIVSDTGGFRYSNTSGNTMRIAAKLLEAGIDMQKLQRDFFSMRTLEKTRLLALCLNGFSLFFDGKMALRIVSENELREKELMNTESGGIIEFLRDIEGVELAVFARQWSTQVYKVSMRSQESVDVAELSLKYEGGGHERAAGFTWKDSDKAKLQDELIMITGAALGYDEERCAGEATRAHKECESAKAGE